MRTLPFVLALFSLIATAGPVYGQQTDTTTADTSEARPADTLQTGAPADPQVVDPRDAPPDTAQALSPEENAKERAQAAAEAWLSLLDDGEFGASWDAATASLRRGIPRERWIAEGTTSRAEFDEVQSRELVESTFHDSTAQGPEGAPVVVLQYRTEFSNGIVREGLITTRPDTTWKVAGYRAVPTSQSVPAEESEDGGQSQ